jgi:general secretion pathway protein M
MMRNWWQAQSARDRRVLMVGGIVVAVLLLWALLWLPLSRTRSELVARVARQRDDLAWMRQAQGQAQAMHVQGAHSAAQRQGKSLLALADVSARAANLGPALKRVEPTGADSVRVSFEIADFDALAEWMDGLARDYGVTVTDFSADKVDGMGLVNARVTLQDARQ